MQRPDADTVDRDAAADCPDNGDAGGSEGRRGRKRPVRRDGSDSDDSDARGPKLSRRDEMQLRLLASLPSVQGPLRDARGRRRSVCVSSSEIVDAGLSSLVSETVAVRGAPGDTSESTSKGESPSRSNDASAAAVPAESQLGGDESEAAAAT